MNSFGVIDYKQPLGQPNDMRTSTYRGHWHITDTMLGNQLHVKYGEPKRLYSDDAILANGRISEHDANYNWQYGDPNETRNPTVKNMQFIKPFEECKLRFIKRPMRPASSVAHQDFVWQRREKAPEPPEIRMPAAVATSVVAINGSKPGYLDPAATTTRLAYVAYTPQEIMGGIGAHDSITFWNWDTKRSQQQTRVWRERDEQMCDNMAAKECPKRRCEFPSRVKHVPHAGLTTEVRENYLEPHRRALEYNVTHIRNSLPYEAVEPSTKKSEQRLYGSGEHTQRYV